jgi:5-methyltetrahydropteroyltriglutamate--homocysteine methyltransferase
MHICRGNGPGGMWAATGGYEAISKEVFPRLTNVDRLLLEYDSDRAGGFGPLTDALPHHQVVLGLVTTKRAGLEPISLHEARHTFASVLIAAGVNAKAITTDMGHASIQTTYAV